MRTTLISVVSLLSLVSMVACSNPGPTDPSDPSDPGVPDPTLPEPTDPAPSELTVRLDPDIGAEGGIVYVHDADGVTIAQAPLDVVGGARVPAPPIGGGVTVGLVFDGDARFLVSAMGLDLGERFELEMMDFEYRDTIEVLFDDTVLEGVHRYRAQVACGSDRTSASPAEVPMPGFCEQDDATVVVVAESSDRAPIAFLAARGVPLTGELEPLDLTSLEWRTDFGTLELAVLAPDEPAYVAVEALVMAESSYLDWAWVSGDMSPGGTLVASRAVVPVGDRLAVWLGVHEPDRARFAVTDVDGAPTPNATLGVTLDVEDALLPPLAWFEATHAPTRLSAQLDGPGRCAGAGEVDVAIWEAAGFDDQDRQSQWRMVMPGDRTDVVFPDLGEDAAVWWPEDHFVDFRADVSFIAVGDLDPADVVIDALIHGYESEMVLGGRERCVTGSRVL